MNVAATSEMTEPKNSREIGTGAPLISVLVPVYNGARYVGRAVQSILDQSERDFELIAVDDGSTDGSLDILKHFADLDARVRLVSRGNRGLVATLNEMLALARGTFLARMDADDIAEPLRFERELQALVTDPALVAIGCSVHFIDPSDRRLMTFAYPVGHDAIVDWIMAVERGNAMSHPALMMRADAVAKIGGYREAFWPAEDADLVLRLAEIGRVDNLAEPLLSYRLHPQSIGQLNAKRQRDALFRCVVEAAARRGRPAPDEALRVAAAEDLRGVADRQVRWAWWAIGSGNLGSARSLALEALMRAPFSRASWQVMACAIRGH
jgi:glycosyltransferase involved in cell wall biosynthesis